MIILVKSFFFPLTFQFLGISALNFSRLFHCVSTPFLELYPYLMLVWNHHRASLKESESQKSNRGQTLFGSSSLTGSDIPGSYESNPAAIYSRSILGVSIGSPLSFAIGTKSQ